MTHRSLWSHQGCESALRAAHKEPQPAPLPGASDAARAWPMPRPGELGCPQTSRAPRGPRPAHGARWALVLAAGEGSRLRTLTTDERGVAVPKQFCSLRGGPSLLERTLARAEAVVPRERVVVVVAAEHAALWRPQLAHLPPENIVVQPRNRGTAVGVMLPLCSIMQRDPDPNLIVLPSDHFVVDEATLRRSLVAASDVVEHGESGIILLGMQPTAASSDLGWIVPETRPSLLAAVEAFVEKPAPAVARQLMARGAMWNTFLVAARGRTLLHLIDEGAPGLSRNLRDALQLGGDALERAYELLSTVDLSRHVFARSPHALRVATVPPCGWTDLGTPQRVRACLAERRDTPVVAIPHRGVTVRLDLRLQAIEA